MIGIGKLWKSVSGHDADHRPVPTSIPRDLPVRDVATVEPTWDDEGLETSDTRTFPRFVPLRAATTLASASGKRVPARIINLSRTGVAVEADFGKIGFDEVALVGTRPVTPGRRIALGAVFLFKRPLDPKLCDASIVL